ncbi:HAD-IC family P-type ATPase [Streptantibioticus rubrisoli]|uniref:Cation-translocating P-type ATPase n=1 Tax=Streptantibioticus rubrisoli TaxID=1387313 RepID=A0ABT1P650_9ACTN|nr:cation-translocating P-type ATPase [Streptantibioticus rubrisoli]MCQ4040852.1 cation-translocating P-type ATPase [Streptantibioticus rubrisoli]
MVLRLLPRLPLIGLDLAMAAPAEVTRRVAAPAGAAVRLAADLAGAGAHVTASGAAALTGTAVRLGRVARHAVTPGTGYWHAGSRLHLPLRLAPDAAKRGLKDLETAARKTAVALAEHPDVLAAYWDGGLARLVVQTTEDAAVDEVAEQARRLAGRHGLAHPGERVLERVHPGDVGSVRTGALALACDVAGIATAFTARTVGIRRSPQMVTAMVTLLREDSRVRRMLRQRLGTAPTDLLLATANAAAHGFGQSPTALALDAVLRTAQLAEAFARAAAFDANHDTVCAPDRLSLAGQVERPAIRPYPGEEYADQAVTGSMIGAAATLLFTRDAKEAAEAVLAGSPKAARYGPAAFTAVLGSALAREGVLVRDSERLRQLEIVDTVVLHPEALRGSRRTVLEVNPSADDWDHDRLWRAAAAALRPPDEWALPTAELGLRLRPVPGQEAADTGLMVASAHGRDVGTVLVGWEVDPLAEAGLDAARRAGLRVVVVDDPSLGDFAALVDELAPVERPLADVVRELQQDGRVVLTVARVPRQGATSERELTEECREVLDGLLSSDVAVSVTDEDSAVVWGADILALGGLEGVWRLLAAVPAARTVGRHAKILAEAGAALSGLLVLTRGTRSQRAPLGLGFRLSPVNVAAACALVSGWRAAVRVGSRPTPHPRPRVAWHALQPEEALARLARMPRTTPSALQTLRTRARSVGQLPVFTPARLTVRLLSAVRNELDDPLTPVLVVGAAASALLGSTVDALLVASAMGMNALVGGVQRLRAERALSALAAGQRRTARRVADQGAGATTTVEAGRLAPGEVIELRTSDVVPADARLLEADDLEVDESSLTGESLPTRKSVSATPRAAVADRRCMVFEGTTVVAGQGRAVVVGTGDQTEAGRAEHLASHAPPAAGVQARLHELTSRVLPLTLAGGAVVTGLSLIRGRSVREAVRGGLAVAVAAVPEGLPLVATVAQMAAARRLSRYGVLVRTPRALEALGRVDTFCFDKTGTLTENRLHVVRTVTADGVAHPADAPEAATVLRIAARACPRVAEDTGVHAHATDEAVIEAAPEDPDWKPVDVQPFEASRGYAAARGTDTDGSEVLVVKGAPEVVLPCCPEVGPDAAATAQSLAGEGLRVLAVAKRRLTAQESSDVMDQPLAELECVGFVALADTPRASSAPLVAGLEQAGVRPVMLTGDHPQTARAMAISLGWPQDVTVVTGDELADLDRVGRAERLRDCGVVARVAPEQKLQVVEALQEAGRVVAMVGDGANDAAAIRAADAGVGIAVRGSAAARNAADLVITTDELSVLIDAIAEGRALWSSVADAISILIGGNAGEVGFTVLGTLLSGTSPLSTRQLLLVNLLTDMFPAMAVAVTPQEAEPGSVDGAVDGRDATTGTAPVGIAALGEPLSRQIRHRGVITGLGATTAWLIGTLTPGSARRTSTMALCGVVGAQLTQTVIGRRHSPLVLATVLGSAAALVALVQTPGVSHFFGCTPLGPVAWAGVTTAIGVAALGPRMLPAAERVVADLESRLRPMVRVVH